jgi:hypothetical protein
MSRLFIFIFFFVPVVVFNGCEEDVLDEPANIQLKVSMKNLNSSEKASFNGGKPMQINAGKIAIEGIEFDGRRENAKDYYFSKTFEKGLIGDLEKGELSQNVSFDIPQGSYYPAKIKLHLNAINSVKGLTLNGAYNHPVFEDTELEFAFFENEETIEITIQNLKGNKKVLFDKGKSKTLEIQLNLNSVFARFNPKRLEEANAIQEGNKRKIIISKEYNETLYFDLVNRIEKSTRAILK